MTARTNILISSAGRRVALLRIFREALQELKLDGRVLAADLSATAPAFHDADAGFQVPRCTSGEFLPALLSICEREEIRVLIPTIDTELPILAASRDAFARIGTYVHVSDPAVIALSADKLLTNAWLVEQRFPTVHQTTPERIARDCSACTFPVFVKPRLGSASVGVERVDDQEQFERVVRGVDYVVEEVAPGVEYTVDVYVDSQGRSRCAVPRRRLEVRAGEVSKGITARHADLENLAMRIAEALPGGRGVVTIQIFLDEASGRMSVIEINPRFGGGFPLTWEAGARYPVWLLQEVLGRAIDARTDCWNEDVVMLRWDDAVFVSAREAGLR
jgi:carbamoyl-phosphate synthase large subunit